MRARPGGQRDADQRRPRDHVAHHQQWHLALEGLRALGRGAQGDARHAAGHALVAGPGPAVGRARPGRPDAGQAGGGKQAAARGTGWLRVS
jgi:hypothetical protein